jgi:hypothetical protein
MFTRIEPAELRLKFNEAMHSTVAHYTESVAQSGVELTQQQLEDASFGVVLHWMYVYALWRATEEQHKSHPLRIGPADLHHPQSHDQCWTYCEKEFGANYLKYAAALTGMSPEEFKEYEAGRRAFFER